MPHITMALLFLLAAVAAYVSGDGESSAHSAMWPVILGPVINRQTLSDTMRGFKTVFSKAYEAAITHSNDLAMRVDSKTKQEEYRWLGAFPGLKEWIGERAVKDLAMNGFVIKNRDFEATVAVSRNDVEDDNIGVYAPLFSQLGENAKQHPDELIFSMLSAGFTTPCFDGMNFFDTAHPNGALSPWSNKGVDPLSAASYEAARQGMMSLVNEDGRPMRVMPSHIIVPPQLEKEALDILRADLATGAVSNVWKNSADVIVAPELSATPTHWFLACLKKPVKPFILQMRKEAQFVSLDNPDDENVFMRKEYIYGVDYRGAAGYGLPQLIFGSTGGAL
ncbi:MAG: Mu-like prophage major head subunit gpT family protein [Nitrospinae bacterium]|nr:Mu-like prophage major head subunit gpT family protein [Nitrospinota bacterium]